MILKLLLYIFPFAILSTLQAVDFNQDGTPDLIFTNDQGYVKTWELDTSFSKVSENWLTNLGSNNWDIYEDIIDLDNDNDVDILIQDSTTGYIKAIQMDGFTKTALKWVTNPGGSDWKIVGTADIDGDNYPDIFIQNSSNGYIKAVKLGADYSTSLQWIGNPGGADWEIVKVTDIDNDNVADIVMQNKAFGYIKAFKLDSSFGVTAKWIGNPNGVDWVVKDVSDVDGDSITDIVLQNTTSGYIKAYQLDSTFAGTAKWVGNPAGVEWEITDVIDVDGDGFRDVVMQHQTLGYVKAYQLDSTFKGTAKWIGNPGGSEWEVVISQDIDGDGFADIVIQNETNGYVKAFKMDSTFQSINTWIGNAGSSWNLSINSEEVVVDAVVVDAGTDVNSNVAQAPHNKSSIPMLGILVSYNNISITSSDTVWSSKLFGQNENELNHYYQEASNSKFEFSKAVENSGIANDGIVSVTLNKNHPNLDIDNSLYSLIVHRDLKSALESLDSVIDFSNYDDDANGFITPDELLLTFVMAGHEDAYEGMHVDNGTWGHQSCTESSLSPTLDGVSLMNCNASGNFALFGERHDVSNAHDATIGIIAHELGHSAFLLPDLYNVSSTFGGIGNFGVMGGGTWGIKNQQEEAGSTPVHFSAWSKVYMGWVTPIEGSGSESLHETSSPNYNVIKVSISDTEYYLLENRNNSGYDRGLYTVNGSFDGGMALWHINKNKLTDQHLFNNSVNSTTSDKGVDLVEAANATIDTVSQSAGDEKALFYSPNVSSFGSIISNISERGSTMTLNIN